MPQYSVRRRVNRVPLKTEYMQVVFDVTEDIPNLTRYFGNDPIDDLGWYVSLEIICPPKVILVLCREVEVEDEREQ